MQTKEKPLPKLDFNVTNRCNFRCRHCCFSSGETPPDEFSLTKIGEVLTEFKKLGGQRIDITGGEATLRNDLPQIIKTGKTLGLKIELVTNASLLDDKKLKTFKNLGLDAIAVSLDGSDYAAYRKIRPVSRETCGRVRENIEKIVARGFYTKINTVVFKSNFHDLLKINDWAIKIGAHEHGFYYFTPVGRGRYAREEIASPLLWLDLARNELAARRDKIKLSLETPLLEKDLADRTETSCYLENPWHLQILPDGNVYPCAIMAFLGKPCGNLYRQSLTEIWRDADLWNGGYYRRNVEPLFARHCSCVNFGPGFENLVKSKKLSPLCLMCKYDMNELGAGKE